MQHLFTGKPPPATGGKHKKQLTVPITYLPEKSNERAQWLSAFSSRLDQYRLILGLTQAEIDSVKADAEMYAYVVLLLETSRQYAQTLTSLHKQLRSSPQQTDMPALPETPDLGPAPAAVNSGIFNRLVLLVNRIKQHSAYTLAMGTDLGIIAPERTFNPAEMMPEFSTRIESGFPVLRWNKGQSDSTHIYADRKDGNGFVLVARTVYNTYTDRQPLPPATYSVTWDYKLRFLLGDEEAGLFSQVVSVLVVRG